MSRRLINQKSFNWNSILSASCLTAVKIHPLSNALYKTKIIVVLCSQAGLRHMLFNTHISIRNFTPFNPFFYARKGLTVAES